MLSYQDSSEKQTNEIYIYTRVYMHIYVFLYNEKIYFKEWLRRSIKQASKMEIQMRVEFAVLSLKFVGQAGRLETQAALVCFRLEAEFLVRNTSFCS